MLLLNLAQGLENVDCFLKWAKQFFKNIFKPAPEGDFLKKNFFSSDPCWGSKKIRNNLFLNFEFS